MRNTNTSAATKSATFRARQTSRGCSNFGPSDLTYVETVYETGRVVGRVYGYSDGENVDQTYVHEMGQTYDIARVIDARRASGWLHVR